MPESIHFHEVGSEDAIVDIVCAAVAVEAIAADALVLLRAQRGQRHRAVRPRSAARPRARHRRAAARRARLFLRHCKRSCSPPPARRILRALDVRFEPLPRMTLSATGYGAGARDFPGSANVVRLILGESQQSASKPGGPHRASFIGANVGMPRTPTPSPSSKPISTT